MKSKLLILLSACTAFAVVGVSPANAGFFDWFRKKDKPAETTEAAAATAAAGESATQQGAAATTAAGSAVTTGAAAASIVNVQDALEMAQSVKNALASAATKGQQLRGLLGDHPQLVGYLDKALEAASKGDDLLALGQLQELSDAAKLSSAQNKLLGDLKKDFEILALGRSFPEGGPVSDTIELLEKGDTTKALASLSSLLKDGQLTEAQQGIVRKIVDLHASDLTRLLPF